MHYIRMLLCYIISEENAIRHDGKIMSACFALKPTIYLKVILPK